MNSNLIKGLHIADSPGCKVVKTPAWVMFLFQDGTFRLLPPPQWVAELCNLIESGEISRSVSKVVIKTWHDEMCAQIQRGINKLNEMKKLA